MYCIQNSTFAAFKLLHDCSIHLHILTLESDSFVLCGP